MVEDGILICHALHMNERDEKAESEMQVYAFFNHGMILHGSK